jgi:hypothetical protein
MQVLDEALGCYFRLGLSVFAKTVFFSSAEDPQRASVHCVPHTEQSAVLKIVFF